MIDPDRLLAAYRTARDDLLAERDTGGHWVGELSSSALSTATAVSALAMVARTVFDGDHPSNNNRSNSPSLHARWIAQGLGHLAATQNSDGGWGDTDKSLSNIATTMLVVAAFRLADASERYAEPLARATRYIDAQDGVAGLRRRYGKDRTFAVPILTNSALAGLVDWREVAPLPFELACLPYPMLRFLRLPVVSYAVPALVAVGQVGYHHRKPRNPITRLIRYWARGRSLDTLEHMQPHSGGFLEAVPLTSFVVMSLAGAGRVEHPVVRRGVEFLLASVRPDGSWPIDTNLATWVTSLSLNALLSSNVSLPLGKDASTDRLEACLDWLLACRHRRIHAFTNAAPGGWGWSDLSGAVPDVDDTAGALLALAAVRRLVPGDPAREKEITTAVVSGIGWLLDLQNRDGGWPTFCRGWGMLPFDRSGVDLSAHAMRALTAWRGMVDDGQANVSAARIDAAVRRGLAYLQSSQRPDGSWVPLWFGNQHRHEEENPIHGTGRVLLAYRDLNQLDTEPARRGLMYLAAERNSDGGWGATISADDGNGNIDISSVEETSVALEALVSASHDTRLKPAIDDGLAWLVRAVESGRHRRASPIGFYFAKLWYYERLYPLVFSVAALDAALGRGFASRSPDAANLELR